VRLAPNLVDIQLSELLSDAWKGHNHTKFPWDKDSQFQRGARVGLSVDNLVSIAGAREALRLKRLMGPPFARKFLLDQEQSFKKSVKRVIRRLNQGMSNDGKVDVHRQFKLYVFDIISLFPRRKLLIIAEFAFGGCFKGSSSDGFMGAPEVDLLENFALSNAF